MSAPTASGPDMSSTSLPVSRHKVSAGPGVAQLREQRRVHQLGQQASRLPSGAKLACARPTMAPSLAATARKPGLVAADQRRDRDVDRLGREHQPGAAEAVDLEVEPPAAVALPRIIEAAGRRAREVEVGPEEVEHVQWHGAELGMDFGRRAAAARHGRIAAGEADAGRGQRPAVARAGQDRGLLEDQRLAVDAAAAGQADGVRRDTSARVEKAKAAPRRPAKAARTWPAPLTR